MITLKEEFTVAATPDQVWPLLSDPVTVAACIPGAALTAEKENGAYEGTMRVKFGPTVVQFRGEVTLAYDHAARRCVIEGRGVDQRGISRALASGTVVVTGGDRTTVLVDGSYHLTGPLEGFARTGGVHVARALLGEFAANLERLLAERSATSAEAAAPEPGPAPSTSQPARAPPQSVSGFRLLWLTLMSSLRSLFKRSGAGR